MAWILDSDRPIYLQIVERLQLAIVSGLYAPGDKVPSVRDFALDAGVNPNTMQKAFAELERDGLILTQRTNGRFVTEDAGRISALRLGLALEQVTDFLRKMQELGFDQQEIMELITERSTQTWNQSQ